MRRIYFILHWFKITNNISCKLFDHEKYKQLCQINNSDSKRYFTFKNEFNVEPYLLNPIHECQCSVFAKLRCGILPLHIETARYTNTALENRLCEFCGKKKIIEDEKHFICSSSYYNDLRNSLYSKINYTEPEFQSMTVNDKFVYMLQNKQYLVAKFCHQAFSKRRQKLYN